MNKVVVADADALIALALENDPHHENAVAISAILLQKAITVIFPATAFPEAITTLKRALNQPEKAHLINRQLGQGVFQIEYPDVGIITHASNLFEQATSKRNTLFDAIVAATAEKLDAEVIFSYDGWYPKLGFQLASSYLSISL